MRFLYWRNFDGKISACPQRRTPRDDVDQLSRGLGARWGVVTSWHKRSGARILTMRASYWWNGGLFYAGYHLPSDLNTGLLSICHGFWFLYRLCPGPRGYGKAMSACNVTNLSLRVESAIPGSRTRHVARVYGLHHCMTRTVPNKRLYACLLIVGSIIPLAAIFQNLRVTAVGQSPPIFPSCPTVWLTEPNYLVKKFRFPQIRARRRTVGNEWMTQSARPFTISGTD